MKLDPKALETAARRLCRDMSKDPDACAFGHGQTGVDGGFTCDVKNWEAMKGTAAASIRAYLSTIAETHVVVPKIETDEMCEAGLEALRENLGHSSVIMRDAAACYRAMVHAASQQGEE